MFDSGAKNTKWGKDGVFDNWYWENISTWEVMKSDPCLTLYTRLNSKWIKQTEDLTL